MAIQDYGHFFKFLLMGDSGVGKTSLLFRFADGMFHDMKLSTTGVDYKMKNIDIKRKKIRLHIWDAAGLQSPPSYRNNVDGMVLVYDISNAKSFAHIAKWLRIIQEHADDNVEKIILGNKCDAEEKWVITEAQGRALAEEHGTIFFETSAVSNINVDEAFKALSAECLLNSVLKVVDGIKEQSQMTPPANAKQIRLCRGCCAN